ncbi:iron uptake system protein EfeO [Wenjunlia tyrosinilytica]|uniref:Lipoprotein n=1 Tax=Wenjunlia tyrosinilytica TaxID=1544741 RepID=A0A917ZC10_9ACTN|nr:iron uptake system protein EfeO [Wenjunlia tyrosinilytica]GGO80048.1 lipoprotein [Wenjunlia tyrosinilytica]
MPAVRRRPAAVGATSLSIALAALALAGCADKAEDDAKGAVEVTATDSKCEVSKKEFAAGHVSFAVHNKGSKVTEVYVYGAGDRIVTERENIGPGTRATINAEVKAGDYEIACKPGMKGDGIRQKVSVTGKGAPKKTDPRLNKAVADYRTYTQSQADETIPVTQRFADAVKAGDVNKARSLYALSRIGWERTEPVAESFGDIDPKVDVREDGLEKGQDWTGWHRLEKSLWQAKKISADDKKLADTLMTDLKDWQKRVGKAEITPTSMANGAKELLDEVATGKVTGEEERYSHTDLVDFNANVEGAKKAYELLEPVASENNKALTATLDREFADIEKELAKYRKGDAYVSYDTVGKDKRKELSDAVNALAEPLSKLAAAVVVK